MTLLVLVFLVIVAMTFGALLFAMRPTRTDKTIEQRISTMRLPVVEHTSEEAVQLLKQSRSTSFAWLESAVVKFHASRKLHSYIDQSQVRISVGAFVMSTAGLAAAGALLTYKFLPVLPAALAAAVLASLLPYAVLAYKRNKRIAAFNAALPDCIDMMGRALRAGHSMIAAIEMVSEQCVDPLASEFGDVFQQQNFGLPLREALMHLLERVPSQDLRVLVTAILVQRDTGGNLAEILDRTATVIRERLRIKGEIRIHTAQGRLTGWILSLLPVTMLLLINIVNPGYSHVLLVDPLGQKLIYVGIGLTAAGALTIRHIVNGIDV